MEPKSYFSSYSSCYKRRYDALKSFFNDGLSADECAKKYGFTLSSFYALSRDFHNHLKEHPNEDFFFKPLTLGRKKTNIDQLDDMIIGLRKNNFSSEDIVGIVNAKQYQVSYGYVYNLLKKEGFARLPRRSKAEKSNLQIPKITAPIASQIEIKEEKFHSHSTGLFTFLTLIKKYGN